LKLLRQRLSNNFPFTAAMLPQRNDIVFYHYSRPLLKLCTANQTARFYSFKDHTSAALSAVCMFVLQPHFVDIYDTSIIVTDTQQLFDCLSL